MFRLIESKVVPLTRQLAEQIRDLEPSPTERLINEKRLQYLRDRAKSGLLVTFSWATARLGDRVFRMNGQHSSMMLCELDGEFPSDIFVHLDNYEVEDMEGLASLFQQIDSRRSSRSLADIAGAYQGTHLSIKDVPRDVAKLGLDGIIWYERQVIGVRLPGGDQIYSLMGRETYHPYLIWLGDVISKKTPEMRNPVVLAAVYATFIKNESEAKIFWSRVARGGEEGNETDPTTVLDRWLVSLGDEKNPRKKLKPAHIYQGCAYAWNSHRDEREIKDIKASATKFPSEMKD